ncbi:MAG TPA: HPr-rel-A system PqqD family peptide chaperone [Longimicrobiales bacterium]
MSTERRFFPSDDAIAAQLTGEAVLLHLGSRRYFRLNETATEVWAALDRGISRVDAITDRVCERFDVSRETAAAEVARLLGELEERGLVRAAAAS